MIIIVGAGFSGLLLAYRLLQNGHKQVLVLEKYKDLGGRIYSKKISEDQYIEAGAGIIREDETKIIHLLNELEIPIHFWKPGPPKILLDQGDKITSLDFDYKNLIDRVCINKSSDQSFLQIIEKSNLSEDQKRGMIIGTSYTELLHGNSEMVCRENDWYEILLDGYQLGKPKAWSTVIQALSERIKEMGGKILRMHGVDQIKDDRVICKNKEYVFEKLIVTCPYHQVKEIKLPISLKHWKMFMNHNFFSVSYLRIYAYYENPVKMEKTVYNGPLKKIIPLNEHLIMVAYTDGKDAEELELLYKMNKKDLKKYVEDELERLFGVHEKIGKLWFFFWKDGIGWWKPSKEKIPLDFIQHPVSNIYFCGDTYSENNGQLNGCVKSVNRILENF